MLTGGRIVQVDVDAARKRHLHLAHAVARPWLLANAHLLRTGRQRLPIDFAGRDNCRLPGPVRHHLISARLQIGSALLQSRGRNGLADQIGWHVPVRIEGQVVDHAADHGGRRVGRADDNLHAVDRLSILIHRQPCGGRIHDDETARRRQNPRAFQVGEQSRIGNRLPRRNRRIPDAAVNRVHVCHAIDLRGKVGSCRGRQEDLVRARMRAKKIIAIDHPLRRRTEMLHVGNPRPGEGHFRSLGGRRVASGGLRDCRVDLRRKLRTESKSVDR